MTRYQTFLWRLVAAVSVLAACSPGSTGPETMSPEDSRLGDLPAVQGFGSPWVAGAWGAAGADKPALTPPVVTVQEFGATPDDGRSDSGALAQAVAAAASLDGPAMIELPPGRFLLTERLVLASGVILSGAGPGTELAIDFAGRPGPGIVAEGHPSDTWLAVRDDLDPGSESIELVDAATLNVGDVIEIEQRTNPEYMFTRDAWRVDWGVGAVGELNRVAAIDDTTITLASPLNGSYQQSMGTAVRLIEPITQVGIENLSVVRLDEGYGDTIVFEFAADVWLDSVDSRRTSRAHVAMNQVYRCQISGSAFHLATDYGDGGRAYGISLARHTTGCLVADNALWDLRHAIIIQLGASGNVIVANDARGSAGYADRQPRADLSLHGHLPRANLFEANVFDRVSFADWWGPSGAGNTLFRNCVLDSVLVADRSNRQVLIGNRIGPGGLTVEPGVDGTIAQWNRFGDDAGHLDAPMPRPGDNTFPISLAIEAGGISTGASTPVETASHAAESCWVPASDRSDYAR